MTTPRSLDDFYSPPNDIDRSRLEGTLRELVGLLSARHESARVRTVLPARVHGMSRWYGLAPSDREARLLREELRCWLGPPISGRMTEIQTPTDPLDQVAQDLVPHGVALRVDVLDSWQAEARNNVASLTDIWALAPERGVDQPRPVGRVLRQFYEAVLAADRQLAESALDEIKARALLSATNIRFLRVELLSGLGTPQDLRDDPLLRGITLLARPQAVTERLAAAADALFIESASDPAMANWTDVAKDLEEAWPALVTHREQVSTLSTARCFVLQGILTSEPRGLALNEVVDLFPEDPVLRVVVRSAAPSVPLSRADTALERYHAGDYWASLQVAEAQKPTRSTVSVALAAAVNIGDSAAAVRALMLVDALSAEQREQFLATTVERAFYDQLLARTSAARLPANWLEWLRGEWTDRPDLLTEWAGHWQREGNLDQDAGALAVELLEALNDSRRGRIRNGLPVFIEWLVNDGLPASGVPLAATIFDILLSSEPGRTERQVSLTLLEQALLVGCAVQEYIELIEAVARQLRVLGSRDVSWLAECLDLFMLFSSPDVGRRNALFADASGIATAWLERLESSDIAVLQQVFGDAGISFGVGATASTSQSVAIHPTYDVRSVGIYSLLESASRVAAIRIRAMFPTLHVETSSGHVNSGALGALVRGADVMLVQTSHAKHAATHAINAATVDPSKVVLVNGRGATALVREFLAWIHGAAGATS